MKKRGQHYVWKTYLRPWSSNELLFCLRDGNIFETNIGNVAKERDFYRLNELNENDINMIKLLAIKDSPAQLQMLNLGWIKTFTEPFEFRTMLRSRNIMNIEIETAIDEVINNLEEDLHSLIEDRSIVYLDSILNKDITFYKTEKGNMDFSYYLCVQYMRTSKIKSNVIYSINTKNLNYDIEKIWNVLSHIYATNMGWSLYGGRHNYHMVLIVNKSPSSFITGDQPVVNTFSTIKTESDLEFYYPVSPNLAVLITEKQEYLGIEQLVVNNEDEIKRYNNYIVNNFKEQIYSHSRELLLKIKEGFSVEIK